MTEVFSAERIDPGELDTRQRAALSKELYALHRRVFDGLDQTAFDHYVVNSPATQTKILLYRNRRQELVGYFGVHRFEMEVDGQALVVFRGEVESREQDDTGCCWVNLKLAITVDEQPKTSFTARVAIPAKEGDNPWERVGDNWKP